MRKEDKIRLAVKMDNIVRTKFNDENNIMPWLALGVPDEATKEDYEWFAEEGNEEEFDDLVDLFISLVDKEMG